LRSDDERDMEHSEAELWHLRKSAKQDLLRAGIEPDSSPVTQLNGERLAEALRSVRTFRTCNSKLSALIRVRQAND